MILLITLLAATSFISAASRAVDLGPVKGGMPKPFVCLTFAKMLNRGVTIATELNDGRKPTGLINVPYQKIATKGYAPYVAKHPKMIDDSAPLIASVNNNAQVRALWNIVLSAKDKPLLARTHALSMYWNQTNVPLTQEEETAVPNLRFAPHMVAIMIGNQKLELKPARQAVWNAVFAATASIMQAMETEDHEAFCKLFSDDLPTGSCVVQ